jgi:hypothetical protein
LTAEEQWNNDLYNAKRHLSEAEQEMREACKQTWQTDLIMWSAIGAVGFLLGAVFSAVPMVSILCYGVGGLGLGGVLGDIFFTAGAETKNCAEWDSIVADWINTVSKIELAGTTLGWVYRERLIEPGS